MPYHGDGKNRDYVLGELPVDGCDCKPCKKARVRKFQQEERRKQREERRAQQRQQARPSTAFGTGNSTPQYPNWTPPVHGTTYPEGNPVTASFGTGPYEDHTLLKDGHADRDSRFSKNDAGKQHDHYGPDENEPGGSFGTQRGKYTGDGS